jgi:thioredoxin reductase (NADPH)
MATVIETRRSQVFPTLAPGEVERLRRFGEPRRFASGESVVRAGEIGHGLMLILKGRLRVTRRDERGLEQEIVVHEPGGFTGELAQLSGRPALVDAVAVEDLEAIALPPEKLRAMMVAEAELGERIMRALILRRVALIEAGSGPVIVGREGDPDVLRLQGFLRRNGHPHQRLCPDDPDDAQALLGRLGVHPEQLPIVICPGGQILRNPSEGELARCLGLVGPLDPGRTYDVAIIGAGPAGLAAAVYAGSEGLSALVLDCRAFGGQAGASARIENYLGFPTGISGMALMARAYNQAQKFGVDIAIPDAAVRLEAEASGRGFCLQVGREERVSARSVVLASGARYRRLQVADLEEYEGASVHYWASPLEAKLCAGQEVALVGAGNSAGQACVYLASQTRKVWLLVRGEGLEASMSRYLVDRIQGLSNVELVTGAQVSALEGEGGALSAIRWREGGAEVRRAIKHLFLFIGADPNTDWLAGSKIELDPKGFVVTGTGHPLQTSRRGVFAIGDVRAGSVKRVASAVGEGAQVVAALHGYLAEV